MSNAFLPEAQINDCMLALMRTKSCNHAHRKPKRILMHETAFFSERWQLSVARQIPTLVEEFRVKKLLESAPGINARLSTQLEDMLQ